MVEKLQYKQQKSPKSTITVFPNMMMVRPSSSSTTPASSLRDTSWRDTSFDFSRTTLPLAMMDLEEYDEAIAAITLSSPTTSDCTSDIADCDLCQDEHMKSMESSILSKARVSSVCREDLRRISLIGKGRFSKVHLATGPSHLLLEGESSGPTNERSPRTLVAVKSIDSTKVKTASELTLAAGELANEAMILAELDHENIVRLRGVCSETFSGSFGWGGFYLVFEVLQETLCDRLQKWRRQKHKKERLYRKARGLACKISPGSRSLPKRNKDSSTTVTESAEFQPEIDERKRRLYHRIQETVLGITKGMEYLHSKGIVLRDLKPGNIGYEDTSSVQYGTSSSDTGQVKRSGSSVRLFDFGMAQKVETCDPHEACGSLRYMAPESMTGKGYSLMVDVYSFGVVLFEICSLCHPFEKSLKPTWIQRQKKLLSKFSQRSSKHSQSNDNKLVQSYRDRFLAGEVVLAKNLEKSVFCPELRSLIEDCCAFEPTMRPTFTEIRSTLTSIFDSYNDTMTEAPALLRTSVGAPVHQ